MDDNKQQVWTWSGMILQFWLFRDPLLWPTIFLLLFSSSKKLSWEDVTCLRSASVEPKYCVGIKISDRTPYVR
eukprot:8864068-Ditylum_brightwellii.AAC.1